MAPFRSPLGDLDATSRVRDFPSSDSFQISVEVISTLFPSLSKTDLEAMVRLFPSCDHVAVEVLGLSMMVDVHSLPSVVSFSVEEVSSPVSRLKVRVIDRESPFCATVIFAATLRGAFSPVALFPGFIDQVPEKLTFAAPAQAKLEINSAAAVIIFGNVFMQNLLKKVMVFNRPERF
jgi:hypothetical protein